MKYFYGMRLRGFSPGAQPKEGLIQYEDTDRNWTGYYSILTYNRRLSESEISDYELTFIEQEENDYDD